MAGRGHVDVNERRLRPIYEHLDNGNNKRALQEADKLLKKQKDFQCAKALKALALLRLGRQDESSAILEEIHALGPTDDATMQAMAISYRETHRLELIASMYENAHKAKPDNEEFLSALFMAYVRIGNYQKQKQTALALHKLQPQKNPYYFWAVMSIIMQAQQDQKLAKAMLLPLAEKMVLKYVKEDKIKAEAEVQLYLLVLEQLGKVEEALQVVQGPLAEKLNSEPNCAAVKEAQLLCQLGRWPQVNTAYRKLLQDNPDHWLYWTEYLKSTLALQDMGWTPPENSNETELADHTTEKVLEFINKCIQEIPEGQVMRGPFLAKLELLRLLKDKKSEDCKQIEPAEQLLKDFYKRFWDRFSCFSDMRPFMYIMEDKERHEMVKELLGEVLPNTSEGQVNLPQDKKEMQKHICLVLLARYSGLHEQLTNEQRVALIKELIERYKHGLSYGTDLLSTDIQFSDTYILVAGHLLIDIWRKTGSCQWLLQAIGLFESARKNSPANYQIKLLLIRMYCVLGAFGPCPSLYDSMEVKHIQNDSIGYLMSNHVRRLGHFSSAVHIYSVMLSFFSVNYKDTSEYLISAYKYGSFYKVLEFVRFRQKLQNSLQFASATADRLLLDLMLETTSHQSTEQIIGYAEIDPEKEKTEWEELSDNRDLTVMTTWDPPLRCTTEEIKEKSFSEEKAWLKVYNLTLRALAASVHLSQGSKSHSNSLDNGDKSPRCSSEVLKDLIEEMSTHIQTCTGNYITKEVPLHGPHPTRLNQYITCDYYSLMADMLQLVLYTHRLQQNGMDKVEEKLEDRMKSSLISQFKATVKSKQEPFISENECSLTVNVAVLEHLVLAAEILALLTSLVGVCHRILRPMKATFTKRNKKKKEPQQLPCTFTNFTKLIEGFCEVAEELKKLAETMDTEVLAVELSRLKITETFVLNQDENQQKEIWDRVKESHQQTFKETKDLVANKLQYLSSLKL